MSCQCSVCFIERRSSKIRDLAIFGSSTFKHGARSSQRLIHEPDTAEACSASYGWEHGSAGAWKVTWTDLHTFIHLYSMRFIVAALSTLSDCGLAPMQVLSGNKQIEFARNSG